MSDNLLITVDFINTFALPKSNYSCNRQFMVHYIVRWGDSSVGSRVLISNASM